MFFVKIMKKDTREYFLGLTLTLVYMSCIYMLHCAYVNEQEI